jgi:hypothetical protein
MAELKYLTGIVDEINEDVEKGKPKLIRLDTKDGERIVSVWDEMPKILKVGGTYRMATIEKPSADGERVWINLYKPRGGEYEVESVGQQNLEKPEVPKKLFPAEPMPKAQVVDENEFRKYQQAEMLKCIADAQAIAKDTPSVDIGFVACAFFTKRAKHQHYFDKG